VAARRDIVRLLVGVAISAVFLAVTLSRVNLEEAAAAIGRAAPLGLAAAFVVVLIDLASAPFAGTCSRSTSKG
jgi:uncharacterized membrane protein YbhN (UPF0104 family)